MPFNLWKLLAHISDRCKIELHTFDFFFIILKDFLQVLNTAGCFENFLLQILNIQLLLNFVEVLVIVFENLLQLFLFHLLLLQESFHQVVEHVLALLLELNSSAKTLLRTFERSTVRETGNIIEAIPHVLSCIHHFPLCQLLHVPTWGLRRLQTVAPISAVWLETFVVVQTLPWFPNKVIL